MEHRTLQNEVPFPHVCQSSLQSVCIIRSQIHLSLTALFLFATKKEIGCDLFKLKQVLALCSPAVKSTLVQLTAAGKLN